VCVEHDSSFWEFFSFALKIGFLYGVSAFGLWVLLFSMGLLERGRFRLWMFLMLLWAL
jgi:hypothetical protein